MTAFQKNLKALKQRHAALLKRRNTVDASFYNGWFERWKNPVVTAEHVPLEWRYDLNSKTNRRTKIQADVGICQNRQTCVVVGRINPI